MVVTNRETLIPEVAGRGAYLEAPVAVVDKLLAPSTALELLVARMAVAIVGRDSVLRVAGGSCDREVAGVLSAPLVQREVKLFTLFSTAERFAVAHLWRRTQLGELVEVLLNVLGLEVALRVCNLCAVGVCPFLRQAEHTARKSSAHSGCAVTFTHRDDGRAELRRLVDRLGGRVLRSI